MGGLGELIEKHPYLVFLAIGVVVLLAYRSQGSGDTGSGDVTFGGGGVASPSLDPNVAGIMQAHEAASAAEFQDLASLVAGQSHDDYALQGEKASLAEQQTLGLAQTAAALDAAKITAGTQQAIVAAQLAAEEKAIAAQQAIASNQASTAKAIAKAQDNTQLANGFFDFVSKIISNFL